MGLFPVQAREAAPWMIALAAIGILYGALLALVQKDFWRLLAYGTLSSLSFCTLGIYGFTLAGLDGALLQTVNEGIVGGALFVMFGFLYERYGTSQIGQFGGVARKAPTLATLFVISSLALVGLPLLNGFVGEFLVLSSTFTGVSKGWAVAATAGVILSAAYMLQLVQRIFLGEGSAMVMKQPADDLRGGEKLLLGALAVLMLALGVSPNAWLAAMEPGLKAAVATSTSAPPAGSSSLNAAEAVSSGMGGQR
uniref:NADH:ubiquinone oxidoreductase, membrane subunit M n=1 Tax=mine drainage metagenome TaxID=410659 RepID=E6PZ85_9ZZZZ